ncbi:MAG: thiamine pyrophosphate-binding protein [Eubacteriales bacterium]
MMYRVADLILDTLAGWGVKNIYGVAGDAVLPMMDALGRQDRIKFYSAATEHGAAFMASGESLVTGLPGVCLAAEGPGALNLLNGLAGAYRDGVPLLALTGQVPTAKLETNAKQYINQQGLFNPVTGFTALLTRPESVTAVFRAAMETAAGDSVPCHVAIPRDILECSVEQENIPPLGRPRPPGISGDVGKAVDLVRKAAHPVILAGKAALPVQEQVLEVSRRWGAAVIPAQGARAIIPGKSPLFAGGLGEAHIPSLMGRADCLLLVGNSPYEIAYLPETIPLVQVEPRYRYTPDRLRSVILEGDVAGILAEISRGLAGVTPNEDWLAEISSENLRFTRMIEEEDKIRERPIPPRRLVAALNKVIPERAVIVVDSGQFMHWFDRGFIPRPGQSVIISDNWRSVGFALPAGIGAGISDRGRPLVVLTGDGGLTMALPEFITAARYDLPMLIIVFNDSCYALEVHRMEASGLTQFGLRLKPTDFAALARACGAAGYREENPGNLEEVLSEAMANHLPAVVDVVTEAARPCYLHAG